MPQRGIVEAMTDATGALADRLFRDAAGALELYTIYLGDRLGLYRALHEDGPATSGELAVLTGTNERYVREWLEHHAASGLLEVDVVTDPLARRFSLPAAHVPVLVDRDDVRFGAYRAIDIVRAARPMPESGRRVPRRHRSPAAAVGARGPGSRQPRGLSGLPGQQMAVRDPRHRPPVAR